jgi:vancomycin resistance protein YoaR
MTHPNQLLSQSSITPEAVEPTLETSAFPSEGAAFAQAPLETVVPLPIVASSRRRTLILPQDDLEVPGHLETPASESETYAVAQTSAVDMKESTFATPVESQAVKVEAPVVVSPVAAPVVASEVKPAFPVAPVAPNTTSPRPLPPQNVVAPLVATRGRAMPAWVRWAGIGGAALLVAAGGVAYGWYASAIAGERIAPGLWIQGTDVGGLTKQEAKAKLEKRFGRLFVAFETPDRPYKVALKQVGGEPQINRAVLNAYYYGRNKNPVQNVWNVVTAQREPVRLRLPVKWDKAQMRRTMYVVARNYQRQPRDASLQVMGDGVQVVPEQAGRAINVGATLLGLQKKYFVGLEEVPVVTKSVQPRLTAADLAGRDVKLGIYDSNFNSGLWGRTRNIYVAAAVIDGKVLMPGQEFSFNKATGERTWDKGYRMAKMFERKPGKTESEVVDGLAGGICQVSSTLYNAVRKANKQLDGGLRIVERNHHSLPVDYVPYGLDATVAWPNKDFRFRNTLPHPIYLRATVEGSRLITTVWGRVPDNPQKLAALTSTSTEKKSNVP